MMKTFNRRDFLKLAGCMSAAGPVLSMPGAFEQGFGLFTDPQIRFGELLIRATLHGVILSSSDDGKTWNKLVSFGEQVSVSQLVQEKGQIYATLSLNGHTFWLRSLDGKQWHTIV